MPRYPSLFQINARVWLNHLSRKAGKRVTLAGIDDATFDDFAIKGLSKAGKAGVRIGDQEGFEQPHISGLRIGLGFVREEAVRKPVRKPC
jgi:hypothetical protein